MIVDGWVDGVEKCIYLIYFIIFNEILTMVEEHLIS